MELRGIAKIVGVHDGFQELIERLIAVNRQKAILHNDPYMTHASVQDYCNATKISSVEIERILHEMLRAHIVEQLEVEWDDPLHDDDLFYLTEEYI
jgi:hypothetical protein